MNTLSPVKGMRDLYPDEFAVVRRLEQKWTRLGASFGYQEYEAPILESEDLYLRKSSEELVKKQSYSVIDRKGRRLMMRPELTPGLARMVGQKEQDLAFPIRWQSFGPFFRYEKPQRGRTRSFNQWNLDLIGSKSLAADAEVLELPALSLAGLGLTSSDVSIKVSNRRILSEIMYSRLGVSVDINGEVFPALDRLDKIGVPGTTRALVEAGILESKAEGMIALLEDGGWEISPWFEELRARLDVLGIADWFEVDFRIIRGLGYYTGLVFEAWSTTGLGRAIFGGGRYDNLTGLGGSSRDLPGVGFAVGDVAIVDLLRERGLETDDSTANPDLLVTVFGPELESNAIDAAAEFRRAGLNVAVYPDAGKKLAKQFDYGRKSGVSHVGVIGPEEAESGTIRIKDMASGEQKTGTVAEMALSVKKRVLAR